MADNTQDKNTAKNLPYPPGGEKIKYDPQSGMSPSLMAGGSTGPFKDALDQGQEDLKQRGLLQEGQPPGPNDVDMSKVNYSYMSINDKKNPHQHKYTLAGNTFYKTPFPPQPQNNMNQ
ncbi:hypothetical protein BGZ58_009157 [Dissophora ornata]|nr:hypothetical protein BGZ58_009157 [Dissophora ornata]